MDKWIPGCPLDRSGKFRKPAEVKPSWPNWQRNIQEMGSWWCNRLSYPNMVIIGQAMPPIYNWQSSWKNEIVGNLSNFEALNSKHRTTWSVFKDRFMSQLFQQAWRIYSWTPSLGQGFVKALSELVHFLPGWGWKGIPFRFRTLWPIFPGRWSHPQLDKDLNSGGAPADACAEVFGTAHWEPCHLK